MACGPHVRFVLDEKCRPVTNVCSAAQIRLPDEAGPGMKSLRRCVVGAGAGAFALATAAGTQEAKAAGFANTNAGGEQGTVVSTNPMALYYNPGAMAFAKGSQLGLYGGLLIGTDAFFYGHAEPALAIRHLVPAIYEFRHFRGGRRPD